MRLYTLAMTGCMHKLRFVELTMLKYRRAAWIPCAKLAYFLYLRAMKRLLLLVMVFPLLMVSCSRGGKELAAKLHLVDSLIEAEPDSGLALLVSLGEEAEDASRANRYHYQLLLAKAHGQHIKGSDRLLRRPRLRQPKDDGALPLGLRLSRHGRPAPSPAAV